MYEGSGSQFCRTTTGTQPVPDDLNESRFVITFLTILGVRNIMQFQISSRRENRWTNTRAIKIRAFRKVSRKQFFYQMQKITPSGCWIEEVSGFSISILVVVVVGGGAVGHSPLPHWGEHLVYEMERATSHGIFNCLAHANIHNLSSLLKRRGKLS